MSLEKFIHFLTPTFLVRIEETTKKVVSNFNGGLDQS